MTNSFLGLLGLVDICGIPGYNDVITYGCNGDAEDTAIGSMRSEKKRRRLKALLRNYRLLPPLNCRLKQSKLCRDAGPVTKIRDGLMPIRVEPRVNTLVPSQGMRVYFFLNKGGV